MDFSLQLKTIIIAVSIAIGILSLVSAITFFYGKVSNKDLSDQSGWENFKKPFVGFSFLLIALLSVVLVVLILFGSSR